MRDPGEELDAIRAANQFRETRNLKFETRNPKSENRGAHGEIADDDSDFPQTLVQFGSNDYLGLANSAILRDRLQAAAEEFGVGSGASRLITGTHAAHEELEAELADFKRTERALTFSTGYAAAVGMLTAILGKNDFVILDKLAHACLIDGARLSGATMRVFPHNNLEKLENHLRWARERASAQSRILVATESIFSMDGDSAPLAKIAELKANFDALLLLDEAHAIGVIGPEGRGLADKLGLGVQVDFAMGTLSKAVGVSGGYVAASADWIDLLVNRARSFIYSTAPPPAVAATAAESIRQIRGEEGESRRTRLWANIRRLDGLLGAKSPSESAIRPQIVGDSAAALDLSRNLEKRGFFVPAIRFPTVPRGTERLRISLSALHTPEQLENLATALKGRP